ncbi:6-carboxytetrahydropterin synthase [Fimbriimonas ginsengisoli]|nr:6-carboxytetrahydropterin synthase [Fimbriimonas ginsengisoli]
MTRRVTFSSGHRYWVPALSESENRALFGPWASPYNHGHNYVLDVTVEGNVDPQTGMVVNIKRIDAVLKGGLVKEFDGKSLNDEVAWFYDRPSTLENLIEYIRGRLDGTLPSEARMVGVRLEEMPTFWAEWQDGKGMTLTRSYEFAAAHRLHVPALSHEENLDLFGKCNNPAGHGHNYVLEVSVAGDPDPATGMLLDIGELDAAVHREVVDRYDHKNLNEDLPEFAGKATTSEVVAQEIFSRLQNKIPGRLARVRLWETARNAFDVEAA